jgi:hypothetical protein
MNVRRCLRNWGETTATWNKYDGTNNWATAGGLGAGDCETSNIGSISMPGTEVAGYVEIELMPSKIQEWLNNSLTNNGMLLFMSTEVDDLHRFNSRHEASNKPELVITYIPPMGGSFLFNMI